MHHGVRIKDSALVAAAVLSNRYITDRFLPDKAIDLVDEAAARAAHRDRFHARPSSTRSLRRVMQLEIEREALKKETDAASKERLAKLEKELANLEAEARRPQGASGRPRKSAVSGCGRLREQIEQVKRGDRTGRAPVRPEQGRRAAATARCVQLENQLRKEEEQLLENAGRHPAHQGGGRRGRHRRGRQPLDRHAGLAPAGGRNAEAAAPRRRAAPARDRAGRSGGSGRGGRGARAVGPEGSRIARSAASSSWVPRASAKPSWRARWPSFSSTTSTP